MSNLDKYRWGNHDNVPPSSTELATLSTLDSIKSRQGWMIAAQVATIGAIAKQTEETVDAIRLVNDTLESIEDKIESGFSSLEDQIASLETNLIENLNEIKWYLSNVDRKLDHLINLIKFSGATKSAEFNKQGFILYKISSYNDAIKQLIRSIEENPLNIEAYINLGFVYLRLDQVSESINNFEKASRLINEDFSYFEEIPAERIKKTEIFIMENLASFYEISGLYQDALNATQKLLTLELDKNETILTKFKLSRLFLKIQDEGNSISILSEFIEKLNFEPIALAIASSEFESIRFKILQILQEKLIGAKTHLGYEIKSIRDKLSHLPSEQKVLELIETILNALEIQINETQDYKKLLDPTFKESFGRFLSLIELISVLIEKINTGQADSNDDYQRLKEIQKFNSELIQARDAKLDDISQISFTLLLKKIQYNVENGLQQKISEYEQLISLYHVLDNSIIPILEEIDTKHPLLNYISSDFEIERFIEKIIPDFENKITSPGIPNDHSKPAIEKEKEFKKLLSLYVSNQQAPENIVTSLASTDHTGKANFDVILKSAGPNRLQVVKLVKEITGLDLKEAKDIVESVPKLFIENLPGDQADAIVELFIEAGAEIELR